MHSPLTRRQFAMILLMISYSRLGTARPEERLRHNSNPYDNVVQSPNEKYRNPENEEMFWNFDGQLTLKDRLSKEINTNIAKNIILFIGDGMSISTIAAARTHLGQLYGYSGEETRLFFENFPHVGLSKTYCVDKQVADSACSATAYFTGVKNNYGTIGVSGRVARDDCVAAKNAKNRLSSIVRWAQIAGKSTGIVTTTRITHASPAGAYASVANRDYECDTDIMKMKKNHTECVDIATQLINSKTGRELNVILGGGRAKFLPSTVKDVDGKPGQRSDGINLIDKWRMEKEPIGGVYVKDRNGLKTSDFNNTKYLLGLFGSDHLEYHLEADHNRQPALWEMAEAAIKVLSKNKNGYFLFVEGGRIDHAHHDTRTRKALTETIQLANAVQISADLTHTDDTLIVTTSDHSHTMTISGYPDRGNDILGLSTAAANDKLRYTTLSYANGQRNYLAQSGTRMDLSKMNMRDVNFQYPSLIPMESETHSGEDVAIYSSGPWSHLFNGVIEQNAIPHIMAYAACIGDKLQACTDKRKGDKSFLNRSE